MTRDEARRHLRQWHGTRSLTRRVEVNWYENRTNYDGWLALATNIFLPGLRIHARAWVNRICDDERDPGTERELTIDYDLPRLRTLRLRLTWRYDDWLPGVRRYQDCKHVEGTR